MKSGSSLPIMIISAGLFVFIGGCNNITPDKLSKSELTKYINNRANGLAQEQIVNGTGVRLCYQPSFMLVKQELEAGQETDTIRIKDLESKYKDHYYFLLQFSKNGKEAIRQLGNFARYSDMVQVLSFQMNEFVNLTTPQKDTVELGDYFFDQTFGMSDANTLLLSFEKKKIMNAGRIEINIGEFGFGTGTLKFVFDKSDIDKMPALDYSSVL